MIGALRNGAVKAIIADDTQLLARASNDTSCRLYILDQRLQPFDIAFAFANDFSELSLIADVSKVLIACAS